MYILGIETSCDDTCVGILHNDTILANVRLSHVISNGKFGGIVPEICAREHVNNIDLVVMEALRVAKIRLHDLDYVAVTVTPGLIGSLLVGGYFAYTLARKLGIPIIPVHHLESHILVNSPSFPCDTFILSGGHTMLVRMEAFRHYTIVGQTLDDAIGEYFDKVGRAMGLSFPAGPYVEQLANPSIQKSPLPIPMYKKPDFSFSGLKTETIKLIKDYPIEDICAFMQITVGQILEDKIKHFVKYPIVSGGGVVSNKYIRHILNKYNATVPPLDLCVDNGIMIARCARFYIQHKIPVPQFHIRPNCKLTDW